MLRAIVVALGLGLVLLWMVAVVEGGTTWLTWCNGVTGVLSLLVAAVTTDDQPPLRSAAGPALLGTVLFLLFIAGLVTRASGWLTWFTFVFAGGYLSAAMLAFALRVFEPRMESSRPLTES